jgi:hypothetical protein
VCGSYSNVRTVYLCETVVVVCIYELFKSSINPITNPNTAPINHVTISKLSPSIVM